jgi:Ricin-type beta-trefoil lectin domain
MSDDITSGAFYVISSKQDPSLVVDVDGGSLLDSAGLILFSSTGGFNQQWSFEQVGAGALGPQYVIIARHSGKCLDVTGYSESDGARVIQFAPRGTDNQTWEMIFNNTGRHFSLTAMHSGKCLDASGGASIRTNLIQFQPTGNANQFWDAKRVG